MARSYAQGATSTPLLGETISENLRRTVERHGDVEALVSFHQGIRLDYRAFDRLVDRAAKALISAGLDKGDRFGVWAPNTAEWTVLQYATARAGVILVNVNPAYRTSELVYALDHVGCTMLATLTRYRSSEYREMIESSRHLLPQLERVIFLDTDDWAAFLHDGDRVSDAVLHEREASLDFDDPINIQFTSGTTGNPKGATLSHFNILNNGFFVGETLRYDETDRICIPVPFYHCFGMVMGNLAATSHGSTMVIPTPTFDAQMTLRTVEAERCTSLYGVPTMFIAELALDNFTSFDLSSLRTGIMAGSPCPVEVMKQVVSSMHMEDVTICYGMTETSPVSAQTTFDDALEKRVSTVGRVHPHVEVKVVDPSGHTLPTGESGEYLTRGYSVMLGYWNEPERTKAAIDEARWMHTGDLAVMDEDGYIYIVGRLKDMIIRGGENVFPREIEEFLYSHPSVEDVAVIGVPDPRYGEEIMAWIRVKSGRTVSEEEILEYCRGRIAHFKVPRYIKFCDEFPTTVTGKVQKYLMKESSVAELGLEGDSFSHPPIHS